MKRRAAIILTALLGFSSVPVQAQSVFVAGQVARIFPSDGAIYFRLKADSCNTGSAYYTIPSTEPNLKNWYALLLAAAETGAGVTVALPPSPVCGSTDHKTINYLLRDY